MTLDELIAREEIRHILALHNHAGDNNDAEGWGGTFTFDAILEALDFRLSGIEALIEWKREHKIFANTAFRHHHVSGILIEFLPESSARVRSNWINTTAIGPDHGGTYDDLFRQTDAGWRIAHRKIEVLWRAVNGVLADK